MLLTSALEYEMPAFENLKNGIDQEPSDYQIHRNTGNIRLRRF